MRTKSDKFIDFMFNIPIYLGILAAIISISFFTFVLTHLHNPPYVPILDPFYMHNKDGSLYITHGDK